MGFREPKRKGGGTERKEQASKSLTDIPVAGLTSNISKLENNNTFWGKEKERMMRRRRTKRERKNKIKKNRLGNPSVWRGETHPRLSFSFFLSEWLGKGRKRCARHGWREVGWRKGASACALEVAAPVPSPMH